MKNRTLTMVCAVVLLLAMLLPLAASAVTWDAYVYTSNGKGLNLRSEPITHADNKIASIPYGATVTIIDYMDSTWAYVDYNGMEGYVMRRYLTFDQPGPRPNPTANPNPNPNPNNGGSSLNFSGFAQTSYYALVRPSAPGGYVNLRWAPSKQCAVYERVYDGQELEVIAQDNSWAQVRDPATGMVGFMMRSFLNPAGDGSIGTGVTVDD